MSGIYSIQQIRDILKDIIDKYDIKHVYLFGSYSRGEATEASDIDLIIDRGSINDLMKLFEFQEEINSLFDIKVDVLIEDEISEKFYKSIEGDKIKLC